MVAIALVGEVRKVEQNDEVDELHGEGGEGVGDEPAGEIAIADLRLVEDELVAVLDGRIKGEHDVGDEAEGDHHLRVPPAARREVVHAKAEGHGDARIQDEHEHYLREAAFERAILSSRL